MSKRKKTARTQRATSGGFERLEASRYFAVVAFAIILVALVILFSDFVFSDEMLHASDQIRAGHFFRKLVIDSFKANWSVPQWNPYIWGGMPYVEAFHGDIFYPGSVLKFILDPKRWQGWTLLIHIYLAGIFMYLAARQFKLSKISALFSAVCYMFAGSLVSLVAPGHDGKIYVTTLFPLAFLFLDRGFEFRPVLNFSLLGLVIGLIILSPHPQMSYMTLWALALYAAFKLFFLFREKKSVFPLIKPSMLTAYAVVVGLCLSAIQFYPGYLYTSNFSPRAETKRGWEWATSWSMHEEEAASIVLPEFVGTNTSKATTYYWGKNVFKDNSETVGAVAILVALIGAVYYRRREAYFFIGLALFALSYALAATTPIFKLYFYLIPKVDSMRAASMIMFILSFSIALLAGMGIQAVRDRVRGRVSGKNPHFQYVLFGLPVLLLVVALTFSMAGRSMLDLWCSLFFDNAASWEVQRGVTKFDLAVMNLPAIQTGAWLAFLFTGAAAVLLWFYKTKKLGPWALAGLAIIPVIDSVRFNSRFVQMVTPSTYAQRFEPNALTALLKNKPDKFRVMNLMNDQDSWLPYFGIEVPIGYHGNQLRWYDNLVGDLSRANKDKPGFLNLMGCKYLLGP
ncbi:MAG: hypothetical protein JSU65_14295, partial [Candidatus Zixiibacteriota bacterium]